MVKIGFIAEGKTERLLVESAKFQLFLQESGIQCVHPVIDAKGSGNLLPDRLSESLQFLKSQGAQRVVILTDLDEDTCITSTKQRITLDEERIVIVAVKKIESWFLADSRTLSNLLKEKYECLFPENENVPYNTIKNLFFQKQIRGPGSKVLFTMTMLKEGFSVQNAAMHPNCSSASYFLNKLKQIAQSI